MPQGAFSINEAVAASVSTVGTVEHIFFRIQSTGNYEFWVNQWDNEATGGGQEYAVAWWYGLAPALAVAGDYSGNGTVGPEDYAIWKSAYGSIVTPGTGADGNGDGIVDAADYTVWRNNLQTSGSGGLSSGDLAHVPEPATIYLLFGLATIGVRSKRRVYIQEPFP